MLYGGFYANFVYQIIFLVIVLGFIEYTGTGWVRSLFFWRKKSPSRLHHPVDDGLPSFDNRRDIMVE